MQSNLLNRFSISNRLSLSIVTTLLLTQAALLGYSATRHSPTHLEPAFLASGLSHWNLGRYEAYRVNPPLPRMVAALPLLAAGCKLDWTHFEDYPGSRCEFRMGEDFLRANGTSSIRLIVYARWACIPFSTIGALCAYFWSRELRGPMAGFVTLLLYVFEPNLLAHGELITPDAACVAFGICASYMFWRWLVQPCWWRAMIAGVAMGLAEASKATWVILFPLWPLIWIILMLSRRAWPRPTPSPEQMDVKQGGQLVSILVCGLYILNMSYAFDGTFTRLGELRFVSTTFSGLDRPGGVGNRFSGSWLESLPVPLPKQYVLGIDSQKRDLEDFGQPSFFMGEWKNGGWWSYYIVGILLKCTLSGLAVSVVCLFLLASKENKNANAIAAIVITIPTAVLLTIASCEVEFNHHLRYVLPVAAAWTVYCGNVASLLTRNRPIACGCVTALLATAIFESVATYPHELTFFNAACGGPRSGHRYFLGSNFDWGQDLLLVKDSAEYSSAGVFIFESTYPPHYLLPDLQELSHQRVGWSHIYWKSGHSGSGMIGSIASASTLLRPNKLALSLTPAFVIERLRSDQATDLHECNTFRNWLKKDRP